MSLAKPPSKKAVGEKSGKSQKPAEAPPTQRMVKHERRIAWVDSALETKS